jgi:CheY-like chemotaxis protein
VLEVTLKTRETEPQANNLKDEIAALTQVRVLVVESNPDSRDVLACILETEGADVTVAASVQEAIAAMKRLNPDLLISAIALPEEDGYTLIRKVRTLEAEIGKQTPAIAVTCLATEQDYLQIIAAGFQRHLPKPLDFDKFIAVATELVKPKQALLSR